VGARGLGVMREQAKAGSTLKGPPARRSADAAGVQLSSVVPLAPLTPGIKGNVTGGDASQNQAPLTPGVGGLQQQAVTYEAHIASATRKPPPLREVIEQYFSDASLTHDRFMHELISDSDDGWVDIDTIVTLKNVKALRARRDDVFRAVEGSKLLEIFQDEDDGFGAVRRPPSKRLPKLDTTGGARTLAGDVGSLHPPPQPSTESPAPSKTLLEPAEAKPLSPDSSGRRGRPLFPGRINGTIVDFDEEAGAASISCPQTFALFQRHVYIDWRELGRSGASINMGSFVSFLVELSPDDGPVARDLQLRAPDPAPDSDEEEDEDIEEHRPSAKRARLSVVAEAQPRKKGKQAKEDHRFAGIVKSFHDGIGFGFIACPATHATFGRDVVIGREDFKDKGLTVGDSVCFTLAVDPEMGTPKATKIAAGDDPEDEMWDEEVEEEAPVAPATAVSKSVRKTQVMKLPAAATALVGKRYSGKVKSFDAGAGVGTVICSKTYAVLNQDITVDAGELAGFDVGDSVSFQFHIDKTDGLPKGLEIEAAADEPPARSAKLAAAKPAGKTQKMKVKEPECGDEEWDESAW